MRKYTLAALVAVLAASISGYARGDTPPPRPTLEEVITLEITRSNHWRLRNGLEFHKTKLGYYPAELKQLVGKYIKAIPKNPLGKGDASVASVQDGSADWYYNTDKPDKCVVQPGSKAVELRLKPQQPSKMPAKLAPQKEIQDRIRALVSVAPHGKPPGKEFWDGLSELKRHWGTEANFVEQMLCFHMSKATKDERLKLWLVASALDIEKPDYVRGVLPYLGTEDPELARIIGYMLSPVEVRETNIPPNFSYYRLGLSTGWRSDNLEIPIRLARHVFTRAPDQALLEWVKGHPVETRKPIACAERVVSGVLWKQKHGFLKRGTTEPAATEQLVKLSKHKEWWVRLYVVAMMRKHPEFKIDEVIQRLVKDEHELVREFAVALTADSKKKSKP